MSPNLALQKARVEHHWTQQQLADQLGVTWQIINLWEQGISLPDRHFRHLLCDLFGKTAWELGLLERNTSRPLSPLWFVSLQRNRFFTGREANLRYLYENFHLPGDDMQVRVQVISGAGGIGKTQIALEYAYRFRDDYAAVLWLRTETPEMLLADMTMLLDFYNLPEKQEHEHRRVFVAVKRWLREQSHWLLILDNVEDMAMVRGLVPAYGVGHVLITTRLQITDISQYRLHLQPWSIEEGVPFLLHRARLLPQRTDQASVPDELRTLAADICQELGGLPLALDQAGAYLEETGCSLAGYRRRFQERQELLLSRRGSESFAHPDPVTATVLLALERVEHQFPAVTDLLRLCAFLDPDAIPEELIAGQSAEILGPALYASVTDPFGLDEVYATLNATSLAELHVDTRLLTIHRLVQMVIRTHMNRETQRQWARRALLAVNQVFPTLERNINPVICSRLDPLLPHALLTLTNIDHVLPAEQQYEIAPEIANLLFNVSRYLVERGYERKAQPLLERHLALREQLVGPTHPTVAEPLALLGYILRYQGLHLKAEVLLHRALAIYEQMPISEALALPSVLTNLAMLALDREQYQQAEAFMRRVVSIREQTQGSQSTGPALTSLATIYRKQGRYEEARALFLHALRLYEQTLGPENPQLSAVLNNLANFYWEQGKYVEAEPVYLRALRLNEQAWGPHDSKVAMVLSNLGELYRKQERYEESEIHYLRALAIWEQAGGAGHLQTADTLHGLALLRVAQGRYEEAEQFFQSTIHIQQQSRDEVHVNLAEAICDLALLYSQQGRDGEAEPLFERALQICKQILKPMHPKTATILHYLGLLYTRQGKKEKALTCYKRSLTIREQALGKRHPETQVIRECLKALQAVSDEKSQTET